MKFVILLHDTEDIPRMDEQRLSILVVEDDHTRATDIRQAISRTHFSDEFYIARNPPEAIRYLEENTTRNGSPLPDLILLTLLPQKTDNWDLLTRLKKDTAWTTVPVLAFSDSDDRSHVFHAYQEGITSFLMLPSSVDEWLPLLDSLHSYWSSVVRLPKKNMRWVTGSR